MLHGSLRLGWHHLTTTHYILRRNQEHIVACRLVQLLAHCVKGSPVVVEVLDFVGDGILTGQDRVRLLKLPSAGQDVLLLHD